MAVIDTSEKQHGFYNSFRVQRVHLILWDFIFVVWLFNVYPTPYSDFQLQFTYKTSIA